MSEIDCPMCYETGNGDFVIKCTNCNGTGYDANEDNPFAQCNTCSGECTEEVDIYPRCNGGGKIEDDNDDDDEDEDD
jgi:molecular chaperone DnaJ